LITRLVDVLVEVVVVLTGFPDFHLHSEAIDRSKLPLIH
jgi:hypothetical protein